MTYRTVSSHPYAQILPQRQGQRERLIKFLERDGSRVRYEDSYEHHRGVLRVQPSQKIRELYDIHLEIPVLIATYPRLEARILNRFNDRDLRGAASTDKDIAVLVAADERAGEYVKKGRRLFGYPILIIYVNDLIQDKYSDTTLSNEIAKLMRTMNHFDYSKDVQNAADFFGRARERQDLIAAVSGGQNVGVFGLRRAGKTSLMRQVASDLQERDTESIFVPLNQVNNADDLRIALVEAAARTLEVRLERQDRRARAALGSKMLNDDLSINMSALADIDSFRRQWIYELHALLDQMDADTVFIIDETDFANEEVLDREAEDVEANYVTRRDMFAVLRTLRGLIQLREEKGRRPVSLLAAGISASIFSSSDRFHTENQFFGFASVKFLGPMERDEMGEMVNVLGKRSGVRFDAESLVEELYEEYGGLPHLTRQACASVVDRTNRIPNREVPYYVTRDELHAIFSMLAEGSPSQAAEETFKSFCRCYPSEGREILESISQNRYLDPGRIPQAISLGLYDEDGQMRIGALSQRLRLDGKMEVLMKELHLADVIGSEAQDRIADLLTAGESQRVEFKSTARWNLKADRLDKAMEHMIVKSVCGFLNTEGGTLVIGVADDGTVLGLDADMQTLSKPTLDAYERCIRQIIENGLSITTAGVVGISLETVSGRDICVVSVSSYMKPVFAKSPGGDSHREFYVRLGNSTKALEGNEFVEYQSSRWGN